MKRIAVLDTAIDPRGLHCQSFSFYNFTNQKVNSYTLNGQISHGTMIARILDLYIAKYELINGQILIGPNQEGEKPIGSIEHLVEALEWCKNKDVDIVCISAGSTTLSDTKLLYRITSELTKEILVIAAMDNNGYITIPSSYPFVLGVRADYNQILSPGMVARIEKDICGANVYANSALEIVLKNHYSPMNSIAVPIVAARICQKMEQGKTIQQIIRDFPVYPKMNSKMEEISKGKIRIPLILVSGYRYSQVVRVCQNLMDHFWDKYSIQTSCLCKVDLEDIRFRTIKESNDSTVEIVFMQQHYKTELILVAVYEQETEKEELKNDYDIVVKINEQKAMIKFDGICIERYLENVADAIYKVLS